MGIWDNLVSKIKNTANKWSQEVSNLFSDAPVTEEFWGELEELLISGDVVVDAAEAIIEDLRRMSTYRRISHTGELKE